MKLFLSQIQTMHKSVLPVLFALAITACSYNKNLAQTPAMHTTEPLIQQINNSKSDTDVVNIALKKLQRENDLVIAFGTLNFAWARKGTFYVLANKNNTWQLYAYTTKLPATAEEASTNRTPSTASTEKAEHIKAMYAKAELWKTTGDEDGNSCSGKKDCNINDAETWTLSVATPQNIHTTTYYAPQFFEDCCPGNDYRKQFLAIAKEMMALAPGGSNGVEQ